MLENYLCEKDFVDIKFIDYELKWVFKEDFMRYAKDIKKIYKKMNFNQKQIYKWYCYANIHTTLHQKNIVWDYLNDTIPYDECIIALKYSGGNYTIKL